MKLLFLFAFTVGLESYFIAEATASPYDSIPTKADVGALKLSEAIAPVKAPFQMPLFKKPAFPNLSMTITEKGAKQGAITTKAIQATIDEVNRRGGGSVIIPQGIWNTGRLTLKSNVNLHIEEGAELHFSGEIEDYRPAVFTRNEGVEVMSLGALIYANGQENIAVTGKGKLIGPPDGSVRKQVMESDVIEKFISATTPVAERVYEGYNGSPIFLPMFISPINCKNVYIEGVSLENTAFWNIVPIYCNGVIIRGITVNSVNIPRGDGIDIESSKNVLIEYCTLSCGDDCFTIKAGRGEDGLRVNKPTENVIIRYCLAKKGHGGITCGSETAGMIRNLYVQDCVLDETGIGLRFKTRRPRGGGGENLYFERIRMNLKGTAITVDMLGSNQYVGNLASRLPFREVNKLTPLYRNIVTRDIIIEQTPQFIKITAIPESPLRNFLIENVDVNCDKLIRINDTDGMILRNINIRSSDNTIDVLDGRNLSFEKVSFNSPQNKIITTIKGELSNNIKFTNCSPEKPSGWKTTLFNAPAIKK